MEPVVEVVRVLRGRHHRVGGGVEDTGERLVDPRGLEGLDEWRYAPVYARQDYADGSVVYQVSVDLLGDTTATHQLYTWPQPGLRIAHGPRDTDADRQRWGTDITGQPKTPRRR